MQLSVLLLTSAEVKGKFSGPDCTCKPQFKLMTASGDPYTEGIVSINATTGDVTAKTDQGKAVNI